MWSGVRGTGGKAQEISSGPDATGASVRRSRISVAGCDGPDLRRSGLLDADAGDGHRRVGLALVGLRGVGRLVRGQDLVQHVLALGDLPEGDVGALGVQG